MGLTIFREFPSGKQDLVTIENLPITVTPNEAFDEAKRTLIRLVEDAGELTNCITTDEQYNHAATVLLPQLKRFKRDIEVGIRSSKDQLNQAKNRLMEYIHELDVPVDKLTTALSAEAARYYKAREAKRREEEARRRQAAEIEQQRKQREADLNALRAEIIEARSVASQAETAGMKECAREIQKGLKRWAALDATPDAFPHPLEDATAVRSLVVLAQQHEQGRQAAAKAKARGDKGAARQIEKAAASLPAPHIAPVVSERVEVAPIVDDFEDLDRAKGQHVRETWSVERIDDPDVVPREFGSFTCPHALSKLNAHAKRLGDNPNAKKLLDRIPGVVWKKEEKLVGTRGG